MCGFVGMLGGNRDGYADLLRRMADTIANRGPDDSGYWLDEEQGVGFGHRRLSILDLSPNGHQPMVSRSKRFVIAFNGEIYNHLAIRKELDARGQASCWEGHSDTETLLACFDAFGIEATLKKTVGMFAFALWDKVKCELVLARDRMGEKPLYYGWQGEGSESVFLFGSELKALKVHPDFAGIINRGALSLLLRHNYIPSPHSIYRDIYKLEPGTLLIVSLQQKEPKIFKYWDVIAVAREGCSNRFSGSSQDAVDELELLANDAIRQQMMADVPLGAFLSGGIDSSTVVALMQSQSMSKVKTFTIGFNEQGYNEAVHARSVAAHLGTEHTELYVTSLEARSVIPSLPGLFCEPFADSSQIPTFLVSKLARKHVTVSLSGDGGDELFCGYHRYATTNSLWKKLSCVYEPTRVMLAKGIKSVLSSKWDELAHFIPGAESYASFGDKMHDRADLLSSRSAEELYRLVVSHTLNPSHWVINGEEPPTYLTGLRPGLEGLRSIDRMMALDLISYLPDDILVKVDRAGMGVSLEGRVPLLDHRIVEFAWKLPLHYKLRDGQTKWPLRQILYRNVPQDLVDRPKMGFGVPLHDWLRGPLREWAESLIDEARLRREGYFYPIPIRKKWKEHLSGRYIWASELWTVLMFQAWLEKN